MIIATAAMNHSNDISGVRIQAGLLARSAAKAFKTNELRPARYEVLETVGGRVRRAGEKV